jgi:hypothetical protein
MNQLNIMKIGEPESIRIFADDKQSSPNFVGHCTVTFGSREYNHLIQEAQAKNAGVFFSVNKTDGVGASAKNIIQTRTYYIDLDKVQSKRDVAIRLIRSPAPPSAIVETKNGLHVYWYASDPTVNIEQYNQVQRGLIDRFGADKSAKDISRVLRVPGTMHLKNPREPHLVRVVYQKDRFYDAEQLLKHYPAPKAPQYSNEPATATRKDWQRVLNNLQQWEPNAGERNSVMLIAAGVAIHCQTTQKEFVQTMLPIVQDWGLPRNALAELDRIARWAYNTGKAIPPVALRKFGIGN